VADEPTRRGGRSRRDFLAAAAALVIPGAACAGAQPDRATPSTRPDAEGPPREVAVEASTLAVTLPALTGEAMRGSAWVEQALTMTGGEREQSAEGQIGRGNVPAFLRRFVGIDVSEGGRTLRFFVMPDYLAIGEDADFLRFAFAGRTAYRLARTLHALPPTRKIVDLVYARAKIKLTSPRFSASRHMTGTETFAAHEAEVERRRRKQGARLGDLVAGHKKDVVISARQNVEAGHVAIYGWFKPDGSVVQSLSLVHGESYADYTHALRLVARTASLDGKPVDLVDVLTDPKLSSLISDEGPFRPSTVIGFPSPGRD
jgi:hypothetical protein